MKACIIIPTYNEKENISVLLDNILNVLKTVKKHKVNILVVDDNSPDGTGEVIKKYSKKHKNIKLLPGKKEGFGKAYMRGFRHVINEMDEDAIFMMDADLSHDPKEIPNFLKQLDAGYDFVIGSRYVKGGDIPDWDLKRRIISRGGNLFARFVGGMYKVNDCTTGYRAIKTSLLKKVDFDNLHTKGYAFLSTLLWECIYKDAKVKEIPIIFRDRKFGETKLKAKDMVEFFINAFRLRFKSSKRMIKFMIVGSSGVVVNLGIFGIMKSILFPVFGGTNIVRLISSLTGDELSILYNFLLNNSWTFRDSKNKDQVMLKLLKFHIVAIVSVIISNSVLFLLNTRYGVWDILAKFIGILVSFIWNYLFSKNWTWR